MITLRIVAEAFSAFVLIVAASFIGLTLRALWLCLFRPLGVTGDTRDRQ